MESRAPRHERPIRSDENGAPILPKVQSHIVTFERMQRYRKEALAEQVESPGVLSYYAKEAAAIAAGLAALRYHRAAIQGLPLPLDAMRRMVEAYDAGSVSEMNAAVEVARGLCLGYPANEDFQVPDSGEG